MFDNPETMYLELDKGADRILHLMEIAYAAAAPYDGEPSAIRNYNKLAKYLEDIHPTELRQLLLSLVYMYQADMCGVEDIGIEELLWRSRHVPNYR